MFEKILYGALGLAMLISLIPFQEEVKPLVALQTGWNDAIQYPGSYTVFNTTPDPAISAQQPSWISNLPNVAIPAVDFTQIFPQRTPQQHNRCDPHGEGVFAEWGSC